MAENAVPGKGIVQFGKSATLGYIPFSLTDLGAVNINGSISASLGGFNSTFDTTLACSNVSARKQLTGTGNSIIIDNSAGSANAHVKFGNVTVNAVVTDQVVPAGRTMGLDSAGAGYVAIILDSGTTTINISQGTGLFAGMGGGGSGGSGGNVNLNQVGGAAYALGAAVMAASMPVTISSDQANLPLNLKAVNGTAFALGQATKSASLPMTLASDQGNLPVAVQDRIEITGTISSAAVFSNFPVTDTIGYRHMSLQVTAIAAASTIVVEEGNDGVGWTALTSIGGAASITATGQHSFNFSAKQIRVRQSVYGGAGSSTVTAELRLDPAPFLPATGSGAIDAKTQRVSLASDDLVTLGVGGVGDTAWVSGSGSMIALLKAIAAKVIATLATKEIRSATCNRTSVSGSASSVTILASNASRLGAGIYNDSTAILYLDESGGAATTANYTVQLQANDYYEVPSGFTGVITGIWASATGAAKVKEFV